MIIYLKASGVVNMATKYFMIECFRKNNGKMCLKVIAQDKNISHIVMVKMERKY